MAIIKFNRIRAWLDRNSNPKLAFTLFAVTQVVYFFMLLVTIPHLTEIAAGLKIPDMMPSGFDLNYIMELFTALGQDGRDYYQFVQLPIDFVYPGLFMVSYSLLLTLLFKHALYPNNLINKLNILPIFAGLFDYFENISFTIMLNQYPGISQSVVSAGEIFALLKSAFTTIFFVLLIYGVVMLLFNRNKVIEYNKSISNK